MLTKLSRHASDALTRLSPRGRIIVTTRTVDFIFLAIDRQRKRRGLPLACPYASCHWEAEAARLSPRQKALLRDHLIASHATAMLLEG